jgi:Phospholipase_D-nuclease N-terminal
MFSFLAGFWLLGLLATVFWIWMLVDCLQNPALVGTEKIVWVLVIILLHVLGAIIYFAVAKSKVT